MNSETQTSAPVIEAGVPTRYLILDTNIVSRSVSLNESRGSLGAQIVEHLRDLLGRSPGWEIAISEISIFELSNFKDPAREVEHSNAVNELHTFAINSEVLRAAARLNNFYQEAEIGVGEQEIEIPDLLIAGTAALTGSSIYTTNMRDYPAPFFAEQTNLRKIFQYSAKRSTACLATYIMVPQTEIIQTYYSRRFEGDKAVKLLEHLKKTAALALNSAVKKAP